jgi:hypothetical protein
VRWERLFADLEGALEAQDRAELDAEVADLARAERAALRLVDRVRAHVGRPLALHLIEGEELRATVVEVGADWLLVTAGTPWRHQALVPVGAVVAVDGLGRAAVAAPATGGLRLAFTVALRALARDRAYVRLGLRGGATVGGTVDRVGADHLDLAVHPVDEPRRASAVLAVRTIPLAALVVVRSAETPESG